MGIIDTAKMMRKAQKARSQMSKILVVGKSRSGNLAMLLNGLTEIVEVKCEDSLFESLNAKKLQQEIMEAYNDGRKNLEAEMRKQMSLDSLKDMLGA
jgi:DNA-binding protein YbaB